MEEKEILNSDVNTAQENDNIETGADLANVTDDGSAEESSHDEKDAEIAKLRAIAKKRTEQVNKLKDALNEKEEVEVEEKQPTSGLSREEAILFARGLTEEEVDKASKIAQLEGISLAEAATSDFFTTWKSAKEAKKKSEKAQLGASKASPKVVEKKDFSSSNLTAEEHKALFKARQSK